jgi:uncharacterized protein with HEPN domain
MSKNELAYLLDVLSAAKQVIKFTENVEKERFENDELIQSGVIRQIELMGEATKHLTGEFKARYQEIPWKKMAGMRDILIHSYDYIDLDEVWNAVQISIPDIIKKIDQIFQKEGRSE